MALSCKVAARFAQITFTLQKLKSDPANTALKGLVRVQVGTARLLIRGQELTS